MSQSKAPVIFVNTVAVSGFLNGVCNLAFSTAHWLPEAKEGKVEVNVAEEITANLRMDLHCAQTLYDTLGGILAKNTKTPPEQVN